LGSNLAASGVQRFEPCGIPLEEKENTVIAWLLGPLMNPLLLSIINKGIASLDQNDIEAIRIKYASAAQYEMTLRDAMA